MSDTPVGIINRISGPIVGCKNVTRARMLEHVWVGPERLMGEIIRLEGETATVQVYENTEGLKPGAEVFGTGQLLAVDLGPGLVGQIFDGVERPLEMIRERHGSFIARGANVPPLNPDRKWSVSILVKAGDGLAGGAIVATVQETSAIEHRVMLPPDISGRVVFAAGDGEYSVDDVIARLDSGHEVRCRTRWPVRRRRPYARRLGPYVPLMTGQRVIDTFFPIAKGGVAAIPGGFGTGKTSMQHQLAKWSDADIIIYVGCGERGNEMTEVLSDFPELVDPRTGKSLMERTILIANTSNMPVAAREASIYTGITIAEYFRDMGYHVAMMADSTSRWAEALREISGRLEEMPAEEGFPPYLASRLAEFYERGGLVETLSGRQGSVSIVGAVSPPGGDFSEPVTQHTKRFVRCFWALDKELANARHYPAVNWLESYSEYIDELVEWWQGGPGDGDEGGDSDAGNGSGGKGSRNDSNGRGNAGDAGDARAWDPRWRERRDQAMEILQEEDRLQQIARLVGADALPDDQRLVLRVADMLKEGFLQQNALDDVDSFCPAEKQAKMLDMILHFYERASALLRSGVPLIKVTGFRTISEMMRMKSTVENDHLEKLDDLRRRLDEEFDRVENEYR
ncbi:MAG: V-type ATP synthase subunit A [Firmicutes bacterium]|nr:V-type ATP synthase subunit A [Bacillota bacterium]